MILLLFVPRVWTRAHIPTRPLGWPTGKYAWTLGSIRIRPKWQQCRHLSQYPKKLLPTKTMETRQRRRDSLAKWIVKHDQDKQMFYIDLDKGKMLRLFYKLLMKLSWIDNTSLLNYRLFDDGKSVELYHTEVPQQFSRQGIGTVLAKVGFLILWFTCKLIIFILFSLTTTARSRILREEWNQNDNHMLVHWQSLSKLF